MDAVRTIGLATGVFVLTLLASTALAESQIGPDEIAELKRAIGALQAQNEALATRVATLEAEAIKSAEPPIAASPPSGAQTKHPGGGTTASASSDEQPIGSQGSPLAGQAGRSNGATADGPLPVAESAQAIEKIDILEQRVLELEIANAAQREETVAIQREKERLEQRMAALESSGATGAAGRGPTASDKVAAPSGAPVARAEPERVGMALDVDADLERARLEQRVSELEAAQYAQEDATRAIIRDSMTSVGSNINESVALGGALEVVAGWSQDFDGSSGGDVLLNTAELDLEVAVNEWATAGMVIQYEDGMEASFVSIGGFEESVDRINLDTAYITLGDPQRFPPFLTAGQIVLPFGISTGNPVADVLTIEDPLTIAGFELRQVAVGIGAGFPTPSQTPREPVVQPPIRPQILKPAWDGILSAVGHSPPKSYPQPLVPVVPPPDPPAFNFGIYSYNGDTYDKTQSGWRPDDQIDLTFGYRTSGHCGKPYDELKPFSFCPWTLDIDIDYNSSIFDSRFLRAGYRQWLGDIGFVPGMAASLKSTLGPVSFVGEWNGAIGTATFTDDAQNEVSISPGAWQVSLGYQLDWNPWMESVGAQGTYLAMSYSETMDFGGAQREIGGELSRVGFLPKRRLLIGGGEWFMDGVKFAIEFSRDWDYSEEEGGTGRTANSVFSSLTYVW